MKQPQHLAIIMDGNGRWAQTQGRPRSYGHVKGTRVAKTIITHCSSLGIKWLTLYAFSSENWNRPTSEVGLLMSILFKYLKRETKNLIAENIRIHVAGDLSLLPKNVKEALEYSVKATNNCTGLNLVFCLSYGSRQEIVEAAKAMAQEVLNGSLKPQDISIDNFSSKLWTAPSPDPDLIIRTSGEMRISNFLLWQAAYSEFWFTKTLWPDFSIEELNAALLDFSNRSRRFGGLKEVKSNEDFSSKSP